MMTAAAVSQPVYVMKALDVAKTEDNHLFTSVERTRLLDNPDITATKRTPGILALHHEMTLSLNTKDCLTFGLMNGCECVLEQIIFEKEEKLPESPVAGAVYELEYIPSALLLRAVGAAWMLPEELLPTLNDGVDRRGLFTIRPQPVHLQHELTGGKKTISIKRLGYQIMPADTRIDYGAQGEGWHAVVGDLARPPMVTARAHWVHMYVILSRARSLEGFLAVRLPEREDMNARPPVYLMEEIERLCRLEKESTKQLHQYLRDLEGRRCNIPNEIWTLFDGKEHKKGRKHSRSADTLQESADVPREEERGCERSPTECKKGRKHSHSADTLQESAEVPREEERGCERSPTERPPWKRLRYKQKVSLGDFRGDHGESVSLCSLLPATDHQNRDALHNADTVFNDTARHPAGVTHTLLSSTTYRNESVQGNEKLQGTTVPMSVDVSIHCTPENKEVVLKDVAGQSAGVTWQCIFFLLGQATEEGRARHVRLHVKGC